MTSLSVLLFRAMVVPLSQFRPAMLDNIIVDLTKKVKILFHFLDQL